MDEVNKLTVVLVVSVVVCLSGIDGFCLRNFVPELRFIDAVSRLMVV